MFAIEALYEDNHCLVVNKPAGLLSQGDESGDASLVDLVKADLKERFQKPGNVYLGLVHRLDRPVSGAIVLARTSKAASRLADQFRRGLVEKVYWAIVEGNCPEEEGTWTDVLVKDSARNVVRVLPEGGEEGKPAALAFRILERGGGRTLLAVRPLTGRGHQIRVQLASRGLPILGDRKYGARFSVRATDGGWRIALHAREVKFEHPTKRSRISVAADLPADWPGVR